MTSSISPNSHLSVALVGAGRVGTSVAALVTERGHRVTKVFSRTQTSARAAADRLGAEAFDIEALDLTATELVLIGVSDDALSEVAERIAASIPAGAIAVHFSGSLGIEPLEPLRAARAHVAALHPVQAIPDVAAGIARIPGCAWGVTCDAEIRAWAESLIVSLEGRPFYVDEKDRALWHAAAVTTSNAVAALLASGGELLRAIGIEDGARVLGPLVEGTVTNSLEAGLSATTITGPVVRGEIATIERHLGALKNGHQELLNGYTMAAELVLAVASRAGRVDAGIEARMRELLAT